MLGNFPPKIWGVRKNLGGGWGGVGGRLIPVPLTHGLGHPSHSCFGSCQSVLVSFN